MIKEQRYSCTNELGAEILMVITSSIIVLSVLTFFQTELLNKIGIHIFRKNIFSEQSFSLILSSAYALFLPLMSFLLSQTKQYYPEGRAQQILIWMVLCEFIRLHGNPIFTWELWKSVEQLVRLFWVSYLVCSYTPQQGIRASLLILCIWLAITEVRKGIIFDKAKDSYLIGKNPKLIHNYMKRVALEDDLKTTPLDSCDYIVMGENYNEIEVCSTGYFLGEKKPNSKSEGMLTIGRLFQLTNSPLEDSLQSCRDTCLSFALSKMLQRRFTKLPVNEVRCRKAHDFVLKGLIDCIGKQQDIRTDGKEIEKPMKRLFHIMKQELEFVSDFFCMSAPTLYYKMHHAVIDIIGDYMVMGNLIYLIIYTSKMSSKWLSLVAQDAYNNCFISSVGVKFFSRLDLAITILLVLATFYVQLMRNLSYSGSKGWIAVNHIASYIKDPVKPEKLELGLSEARALARGDVYVQKPRHYLSIFDKNAETIMFFVKVDLSILARLPKWIRKKVPRSVPTVICSYAAKEAVLSSLRLRNSDGTLTNGEIALKMYGMERLNWACQPKGSTTEAILVWHIATALFHHKKPAASQQNNKPFTVALGLSSYCYYLVAKHPELLPDEVELAEKMYESVRKDIFVIVQSFDQKTTKNDCCNYALEPTIPLAEKSLVGKGAKLAKELINYLEEGSLVWNMLADFWAEIMLFIAPSNNVEGHQKLLREGEFITQLWALLIHAGIITRPTPTEHEDHQGEINAVAGEDSNAGPRHAINAVPGVEINAVPEEDSNAVPGDEINVILGEESSALPGDEKV